MSDDLQHAAFLEECLAVRQKAKNYIQFRSALSLDNPKARFPGFRQGVTVLKEGQQVQNGAKPLPVDIVMHESMPMVLSDGTKLYYDVFLPAGFENLAADFDADKRIPALVAWLVACLI